MDEPAAGLRARRRRHASPTSSRSRCSSTPRPPTSSRTCCSPPTWSPASWSPRSTRSGCCKGRRDRYHRLGLLIPLTVAAIATPIQLFVGDIAARAIADDQPAKFAAMECVYETGPDQTEYIGGICTDDEVKYGIGIPGLDSFLVGFSTDTVVTGLDQIPDDEEPPAQDAAPPRLRRDGRDRHRADAAGAVVRLAAGGAGARCRETQVVPARGRGLRRRRRSSRSRRGWIVTEVGRQPWIVYGYMRTEDAVTGAEGLWFVFGFAVLLYAALGDVAVMVLRTLARRWREAERRRGSTPYGPAGEEARADEQGRRVAARSWSPARRSTPSSAAPTSAPGSGSCSPGAAEDPASVREPDRPLARPGLGGQPRLADLHPRRALDRVPRGVLGGDDAPSNTAGAGGARDRAARVGLRLRPRARGARRGAGEPVFAVSSVLTPFFMGTVVGAIAAGEVPADGNGDPTASWTGLLPLLIGALFVASGAYIAAVFLVHDSRARRRARNTSPLPPLRAGRGRRGRRAGGGRRLRAAQPTPASSTTASPGRALPLRDRLGPARRSALLAVLARAARGDRLDRRACGRWPWARWRRSIWGWGVAQHPYLLPPEGGQGLTIDAAAAPDPTLTAILIVLRRGAADRAAGAGPALHAQPAQLLGVELAAVRVESRRDEVEAG